jgi:hypothetical protein
MKVFNYLYVWFQNVSLEDAKSPEVKSLLHVFWGTTLMQRYWHKLNSYMALVQCGTMMPFLQKHSTSSKSHTSLDWYSIWSARWISSQPHINIYSWIEQVPKHIDVSQKEQFHRQHHLTI